MIRFADRLNTAVQNELGTVRASEGYTEFPTHRCDILKDLDNYFYSKQFDTLRDWDEAADCGYHVAVKDRKPKIIIPLPKMVVERVNTKITSRSNFPRVSIEDDPDTNFLVEEIHNNTKFRQFTKDAVEKLLSLGAAFVRLKIINGIMSLECYNPNYCWPKFDDNGELEEIEIRYVYQMKNDKGEMKEYWYRFRMNKEEDVLYDKVEYRPGAKPIFRVKGRVKHDLGFVQGEWVKTTLNPKKFEGPSIFKELKEITNELSYINTLQSGAVKYGAEPQVVFTGVQDDELENLVKRKEKAWATGYEGDVKYLESSGSGSEAAKSFDEQIDKKIQSISRVIMHDPEKFSAHAQSGIAMEMLNAPMVELIEEIRPFVESFIDRITKKMVASAILLSRQGLIMEYNIPPGFVPQSLDIDFEWPPVFPMTIQDKTATAQYWINLSTNNIVSRQFVLEKMAGELGLTQDEIEMEVERVNTQQQFNTFGF